MPTALACLRCGAPVFAEDRFCGACGTPRTPAPGVVPAGPSISGETGSYSARLMAKLREATAGEYEIRGEIGRGGMAAVYLAYDLRLNRKVAIKVMLPELAFHDSMEDRFKREARMAAKLDHPNIVVIYSVRDDAEVLYFVMKFIEGASLEQIARNYAPLPLPIIQHLLLQLGGALQYAHDEGVVHRDVKPPNVLIDRRGNALVTDFGIAKAADVPALTRTGSVIGTPAYMSPEQVTDGELTHASDQYSLGVVAYELITGQPPFVGGLMELQWAHVKTEPASPLTLRPDCPPAIAAAVMRMLAKAPADRFPSLNDAMPSFAAGLVRGDESPRIELAELVRVIAPSRTDGIPITPASPIPRGRGGPTTPWTSIQVSPAQAQLQVGEHVELAVAFLPASAPNVTPPPAPVWTSSAPTIVSVSPSGLATALNAGSAVITAQVGSLAAATTVVVLQPAVASITLVPPAHPLEVGTTHRMEYVIRDVTGHDATDREVMWASSNPGIVSVDAGGEATGHALGRTTIAATSESITATISVEVVPDRVAELGLTPTTLTLKERASGRLAVRANSARGKAIAGRQAVLRSADPAIAIVSPQGVVFARAIGRTTISATLEGHASTAEIVVVPADVATIAVTPQSPSVTAGEILTFSAQMRDATGHVLSGRTVAWKSSDPRILEIDQAGRAVSAKAGTVDVTAECGGATSVAHVIVAPPAMVSLEISASATTVRAGKRIRLRTKARDTTGSETEPGGVVWRSSEPSLATVAADGTVSAVSAGEVTIFAEVAGKEASRLLTVDAPPPPIRVPRLALPIGGGVLVIAVLATVLLARARSGDDARSQTPDPASTASSPNVATGQLGDTAAATGGASINAVATLSVTSSNPLQLESGDSSRVEVRAANGSGAAVPSDRVTWTVVDSSIASVSADGTVTGRAVGTTSVTAVADTATAGVAVVVVRPSPAQIVIDRPRSSSLRVGEQMRLRPRVVSRSGRMFSHRVAWRSSNASVATVDSTGMVRGVAPGETTVSAVAGGVTDSIRVNVTGTLTPNPAPAVDKPSGVAPAVTEAGVDSALADAARALGAGFSRGQIGQMTATGQFSKFVQDEKPKVDGAPRVQGRQFTKDRAEGEVALPLRWKTRLGITRKNSVLLQITLERRDGTWRLAAAKNLTHP
jgi:serine/threonine protein kinase